MDMAFFLLYVGYKTKLFIIGGSHSLEILPLSEKRKVHLAVEQLVRAQDLLLQGPHSTWNTMKITVPMKNVKNTSNFVIVMKIFEN